jgi:Xaa-Pro aminopeptidase
MTVARLTFAPTLRSSDARYLAGMEVHDPFVGMRVGSKSVVVASALEFGNFLKNSRAQVLSAEALSKGFPIGLKGLTRNVALILAAARKLGVRKLEVGMEFPAGIFVELKKHISIRIAPGELFPERLMKSAEELHEIRAANTGVAAAISLVREAVRTSRVVKGRLVDRAGKALTSESLRARVGELFAQTGMLMVEAPIIAGGAQGCNPHEIGHGQLKAGELIVCDIFAPRSGSGYWGDMTRTFIKGTPTDAQVALVEAVADAQELGMALVRPGAVSGEVHQAVCNFFEGVGYPTYRGKAGFEGFFHGLGHSLGLECHDVDNSGARLRQGATHRLQVGEVYTVEPGLYYPAIGGCRIEDNGVVTATGYKLLSKSDYEWVW